MSLAFIESQFQEAKKTLENFISNPKNAESIEQSAQLMVESISKGSKVISCGNGGSMSDAMHFAEELTGRYRDNRKSLPAIAISDPGYLTCAGNDFGYDFV
ncbi:MAG: SIS domain-containing protein, partial [Salibacter sp.]